MNTSAYEQRRSQIEHYFDRTAADAWARLTSNEPVGRIRATVRAGRDEMRATLLSWLPQDLRGMRCVDVFAGTGALGFEAASRGAQDVVLVEQDSGLIEQLKRTQLQLAAHQVLVQRGDGVSPPGGAREGRRVCLFARR